MPKGVEKDALGASGTAQTQANGAYGTVNPIYTRMAMTPMGYTPQQKAGMLTQGAQSLGGGNAAVVGQGNLTAARTGNIGAPAAVADSAARTSMAQQSDNTLNVDARDAELQRQNQLTGLNGLNSIYSGASRTGLDYLNTAERAGADTNNAKQAYIADYLKFVGSAAAAAGGG